MNERFCLFGDSIGAGFYYDRSQDVYFFLENNFLKMFEKRTGIQAANYSIVGSTILDGLGRIRRSKDLISSCDYIGLEFGGNDADFPWSEIAKTPSKDFLNNVSFDKFIEVYEMILKKINEAERTPIVFSLPPIDADRYINYVSKKLNSPQIKEFLDDSSISLYQWHDMFNQSIEKMAYENKAVLVDVRGNFLFRGDDYKKLLCYDGIHPNEEGHKLICDAMMNTFDDLNIREN